jgi:hypothetical protein
VTGGFSLTHKKLDLERSQDSLDRSRDHGHGGPLDLCFKSEVDIQEQIWPAVVDGYESIAARTCLVLYQGHLETLKYRKEIKYRTRFRLIIFVRFPGNLSGPLKVEVSGNGRLDKAGQLAKPHCSAFRQHEAH